MKFLVDANLPRQLSDWLILQGHDSIYTFDFPKQNDTDDSEILDFLDKDPRILVSKDSDFFKSFLLNGRPEKLVFITTGNIFNSDLLSIFHLNFPKILEHLKNSQVIELGKNNLIVHF